VVFRAATEGEGGDPTEVGLLRRAIKTAWHVLGKEPYCHVEQ